MKALVNADAAPSGGDHFILFVNVAGKVECRVSTPETF
jgi:hypothetical protein